GVVAVLVATQAQKVAAERLPGPIASGTERHAQEELEHIFRLRQAAAKRQNTPSGTRRADYRPQMQPSNNDSTDDALARRAEDLQELRQAEHDTTLSGDQREVTGELSLVGQHPADVADFTYQRELQQT